MMFLRVSAFPDRKPALTLSPRTLFDWRRKRASRSKTVSTSFADSRYLYSARLESDGARGGWSQRKAKQYAEIIRLFFARGAPHFQAVPVGECSARRG